MTSAKDILNFNFSPNTLKYSSNKVITSSLNILLERRISKLHKIVDDFGAKSFLFSSSNLIPEVFIKFKSSFKNKSVVYDRRELRTLSYSLNHSEQRLQSIFRDKYELNCALDLFETNWRDFFLYGLIDCLLRNWESKYDSSSEILYEFIFKKLDNYKGNRSALISFKANKHFFNTKNGDIILGDTIAKLKCPIQDATKILGVPDSWISYPYFSRVIVTYFERTKDNIVVEIDNFIDVLLKNNSSITNKRLISKMIIQSNKPQFAIIQDKVKKIAFTKIGDPNNIANWVAFDKATDLERSEILQGRNILNEWITKQFINVFFNVCLNDERRKAFWLRYTSKITSFKVYGPHNTKSILKREKNIADYVDSRFETTYDTLDVSAFILYIGNYMLIEFSDAGYAFYAYILNGSAKPSLDKKLSTVNALRNGNMPFLILRTGYDINEINDEGRLPHNDGVLLWEEVFDFWFKTIAGINV